MNAEHLLPQMPRSTLRKRVTEDVLRHPNMNETGRLPGFCMFHIGQFVRFTQTVEAGVVCVDQTGVVVGIDYHEREPVEHKQALDLLNKSVILLRYMPVAVYIKLTRSDDDKTRLDFLPDKPCIHHEASGADKACEDCKIMSDIVAIEPYTSRSAWSLHLKSLDATMKVKRTQLPFLCACSSTEHVLQGSTCDPGLVFHWKFPKRMGIDMKWLGIYVALSRVRKLSCLKSIGMNEKIKVVIEHGPPDTIPAQFEAYFGAKETKTAQAADAAMQALGWQGQFPID